MRTGVEIGKRPFIGLNFRMSEVHGAIMLAQLRKMPELLKRLRRNKKRYQEMVSELPGIEFREVPDPDGDICTVLTMFMPNVELAHRIAGELGTKVVAEAGWHVYNNMEQILGMKTINPKANPLKNSNYTGKASYAAGMLPQTDRILERGINVSVGVVDAGLGSAFGVNLNSTEEEVDRQAERFRAAVQEVM